MAEQLQEIEGQLFSGPEIMKLVETTLDNSPYRLVQRAVGQDVDFFRTLDAERAQPESEARYNPGLTPLVEAGVLAAPPIQNTLLVAGFSSDRAAHLAGLVGSFPFEQFRAQLNGEERDDDESTARLLDGLNAIRPADVGKKINKAAVERSFSQALRDSWYRRVAQAQGREPKQTTLSTEAILLVPQHMYATCGDFFQQIMDSEGHAVMDDEQYISAPTVHVADTLSTKQTQLRSIVQSTLSSIPRVFQTGVVGVSVHQGENVEARLSSGRDVPYAGSYFSSEQFGGLIDGSSDSDEIKKRMLVQNLPLYSARWGLVLHVAVGSDTKDLQGSVERQVAEGIAERVWYGLNDQTRKFWHDEIEQDQRNTEDAKRVSAQADFVQTFIQYRDNPDADMFGYGKGRILRRLFFDAKQQERSDDVPVEKRDMVERLQSSRDQLQTENEKLRTHAEAQAAALQTTLSERDTAQAQNNFLIAEITALRDTYPELELIFMKLKEAEQVDSLVATSSEGMVTETKTHAAYEVTAADFANFTKALFDREHPIPADVWVQLKERVVGGVDGQAEQIMLLKHVPSDIYLDAGVRLRAAGIYLKEIFGFEYSVSGELARLVEYCFPEDFDNERATYREYDPDRHDRLIADRILSKYGIPIIRYEEQNFAKGTLVGEAIQAIKDLKGQ